MLRRNMTSAECQISDPKGRYLVFTLLFFQMPMMKTQGLNTKIITKKPKSARNCESRVRVDGQASQRGPALSATGSDSANSAPGCCPENAHPICHNLPHPCAGAIDFRVGSSVLRSTSIAPYNQLCCYSVERDADRRAPGVRKSGGRAGRSNFDRRKRQW